MIVEILYIWKTKNEHETIKDSVTIKNLSYEEFSKLDIKTLIAALIEGFCKEYKKLAKNVTIKTITVVNKNTHG